MLYSEKGKPKHSIFYLAHLNDTERMFFITLLYSAVESWMRKQQGTGDLRAIVYFDEILGYLPPVANPASKSLIIRMLKTARAFGVGLVLTTQNPVDVDYKALSNAGTWMVGRLQTDQDKQRLLDGLESASGGIKRSDFDKLISALDKRVFLYHNVHERKPEIFHTRWVMSYLAGPITITQIPRLNKLAGVKDFQKDNKGKSIPTVREAEEQKSVKPKTAGGIDEYFYPLTKSKESSVYAPNLLAQAEVRYIRQSPTVDSSRTITSLVKAAKKHGQDWDIYLNEDLNIKDLLSQPQKNTTFTNLPDFMKDDSWWSSQKKDFENWIYETDTLVIRENRTLGVTASPEASEEEFLELNQAAVEEKKEKEFKKLEKKFASKKKTLENRIERQELKVKKLRSNLKSRGLDTALKVGESLLKLATKKRLTGLSSSSSKMRMTADARNRLKEAEQILENYKEDLSRIETELEEEKQRIEEDLNDSIRNYTEIKLTPTKNNIRITQFGILWTPQ